MKILKILGAGCAKCKQTEAVVKEAIEKFGIEATIEKSRRYPANYSVQCSFNSCRGC